MQTGEMITIKEFCIHHKIEQSFIYALKDTGLVEITTVEEKLCVPANQLPQLEKLIHLYELDINLEGIETITHLLNRVHTLQDEITGLKNKLRLYEDV